MTLGSPVEEMEEGGWAEDGDEEWQEETVAETEEAAPEPPLKAAVTKDQQAAADKAFEDRVKKAKVQATSNNRCCISYARVVQEQEQLIREEKFKKKQANVLARREERKKSFQHQENERREALQKMGIYESTTCWNTRTVLHFKDADSNGFFKGEGFNESSGYCFVTGQWFDDGDRGEILYRDKFGIAELNLSWDSSRGFAEYIGYAEFNKGRASFSKVQGDEALNRDYALIKDYALADLKESRCDIDHQR